MDRYLDRLWLWWHHTALPRRRHDYIKLVGPVWSCSCGSTRQIKQPRRFQ